MVLRAPVGSGKSFAIVGAVSDLVTQGRLGRVLFLAPGPVAGQWASMLTDRGHEATLVDPPTLRLLQERLGSHPGDWADGLYAMSVALAGRQDVEDLLYTARWELVVLDDADRFRGGEGRIIERLKRSDSDPALLVTVSATQDVPEQVPADYELIDWTEQVERFREQQLASDQPLLRTMTETFLRSPQESELMEQLTRTASRIRSSPHRISLLRSAASSISSLENVAVRLLETEKLDPNLAEEIERLLQGVEALTEDAKMDAFLRLAGRLKSSDIKHTVVFCDFVSTADYLAASCRSSFDPVFRIDGSDSHEKKSNTLREFREGEGILVTTSAAAEGVSFSFVSAVIHYDLPVSREAFVHREGRYFRYGRLDRSSSNSHQG
jgi:superfamily II DNA or RNA helicase